MSGMCDKGRLDRQTARFQLPSYASVP